MSTAKHRAANQPLRLSRPVKYLAILVVFGLIPVVLVVFGWRYVPVDFYHQQRPVQKPALVEPIQSTPPSTNVSPTQRPDPKPTIRPVQPNGLVKPKPVTKLVTVKYVDHNVRSKPTTVGTKPIRSVEAGTRIKTAALIKGQDPYRNGNNLWLKLEDGTFMWSGNTDAASVYKK